MLALKACKIFVYWLVLLAFLLMLLMMIIITKYFSGGVISLSLCHSQQQFFPFSKQKAKDMLWKKGDRKKWMTKSIYYFISHVSSGMSPLLFSVFNRKQWQPPYSLEIHKANQQKICIITAHTPQLSACLLLFPPTSALLSRFHSISFSPKQTKNLITLFGNVYT